MQTTSPVTVLITLMTSTALINLTTPTASTNLTISTFLIVFNTLHTTYSVISLTFTALALDI